MLAHRLRRWPSINPISVSTHYGKKYLQQRDFKMIAPHFYYLDNENCESRQRETTLCAAEITDK